MKLTRLVLPFVLFASILCGAQSSTDTVTIPKDKLTTEQKADLDKQALDNKISQYGKWVGVGHEVGTAVNESLSAMTTNAATFSQTGVGKMTIALVIFKVIGKELIGLFVGLVLLFVFVPVWVWAFFRNCVTRRVLVENNKETGKKWELVNNPDQMDRVRVEMLFWMRFCHAGALLVLSLFVCASIFGCGPNQ